ncbi:MAG: hypothetical protein IIX72_05495 [Oscillospiraceae bacterium]|nr:hypothetical protein [Oscillospiraceae bacterium]
MIFLFLLCALVVLAWLIYNVMAVDRAERRETAKEMRQALKWADRRKMKQQADYKAVLRGR